MIKFNKKIIPWIIGIGIFIFLLVLFVFLGNHPTSPATISPPPALP
jgi:hypothetical protein